MVYSSLSFNRKLQGQVEPLNILSESVHPGDECKLLPFTRPLSSSSELVVAKYHHIIQYKTEIKIRDLETELALHAQERR